MMMETTPTTTTDQEPETLDSELMGDLIGNTYVTYAGLTAAKAAALVSKQLG